MIGLESTIPFLYYASGMVTDNVATYPNVRKNGSQVEGNDSVRGLVEARGVNAGFRRAFLEDIVLSIVSFALPVGVDFLLGLYDAPFNFTKFFCYAGGTIRHLQAIAHFTYYLDNRYLNWIHHSITRFSMATIGRFTNK